MCLWIGNDQYLYRDCWNFACALLALICCLRTEVCSIKYAQDIVRHFFVVVVVVVKLSVLWIFYVIYFYATKSSVVTTRSNTTWYRIRYSSYGGRTFTGICINNRHPYVTLTCELRSAYCMEFGENWPRYNGTALYSILLCWHCDNHMIVQVPVILKDISKRSQSKHYDVIKWNIFRVTGPLCAEFTGLRWLPHTKSSGAELWCFLWSAPE